MGVWKLRKPRIGILSDFTWDKYHAQYATYTGISPERWEEALILAAQRDGLKVRIKPTKTKKNLHSYMIVLNPYGGAYPERNLQSFATLDKIFEYVEKGGLFVNIADVPGFYANSPKLNHRVPVGRGVFIGSKDHGKILQTPFMSNLGLDVYLGDYKDLVLIEDFAESSIPLLEGDRAVSTKLEDHPILDPVVQPQEDKGTTVTQCFFKTYGDGKFLISMLPITKTKNPTLLDVLAEIVIREVPRTTL